MKKLITLLIILNSFFVFSQNLFTKDELLIATDGGGKWYKDIKIYLFGDYSIKDSMDVIENIKTFKPLLNGINIDIVTNKKIANVVIYFNTDAEFGNMFNWRKSQLTNIGITFIAYVGHKIDEVAIHIDTEENKQFNSFSNTIRHEMFHMLGFSHYDSEKNSILDMDHYLTNKDIEMIKFLYSNKLNT